MNGQIAKVLFFGSVNFTLKMNIKFSDKEYFLKTEKESSLLTKKDAW